MTSSDEERFAAALTHIHEHLNWDALGEQYCDDGGAEFFPPTQREAITEAGLRIAGELGDALKGRGSGRSLYVGAALAELIPMLCECLVFGREVIAVNLENAETEALNEALAAAARSVSADLFQIQTEPWDGRDLRPCDHVWLVSVLTDPGAFPALHDELYHRSGTPLATQRGHLPDELARARQLVRNMLEAAAPDARLTTTDEEAPILLEQCERRKWSLEIPEHGRLSAIVGDVIRFCQIRPL